jgi:hypothetical protein
MSNFSIKKVLVEEGARKRGFTGVQELRNISAVGIKSLMWLQIVQLIAVIVFFSPTSISLT